MRIVFRADASIVIGIGHVMRCLTLATTLRERGAQSEFVCREHDGHLCELIEQRGFVVHRLSRAEDDAAGTAAAIVSTGGRPRWLVIDHYGIDGTWEHRLRASVERILVIDDLANRQHECDLLLDQNLVSNFMTRYGTMVPSTCGLLLGPEYALLQSPYAELHERIPPRAGAIHRILISFGGADRHDCTGRALKAVLGLNKGEVDVDVAVSSTFEHLDALHQVIGARANVRIHKSLPTLATLMVKADLAIGAAGATSWERLCLGLPAVVVTLAANQRPIAEELSRCGLVIWLGDQDTVEPSTITRALRPLMDSGLHEEWSARCRMVVDGAGARRVCAAMVVSATSTLRARRATPLDEDRLLRWANDPETRRNAFSSEPISPTAHHRWFRDHLRDVDDSAMYIVETTDDLALGVVRFQRHGDRWEVHYALSQPFRRRGIGRRLLEAALLQVRALSNDRIVFGRVKESNHASRRVFESLGFSRAHAPEDGTLLYERLG